MKSVEIFNSYEELKPERNKNTPVSKEDLRRRKRAVKKLAAQFNQLKPVK